jgi:hypothetical protein
MTLHRRILLSELRRRAVGAAAYTLVWSGLTKVRLAPRSERVHGLESL